VGSHLKRLKLVLESDLAGAEGRPYSSAEIDKLCDELSTIRVTKVKSQVVSASELDLLERSHAGGTRCDCCGKQEEDLGTDSLLKCARCRLVFYCSTECQRKAWNGGHKRDCRKKGQVKVGDDMLLNGLVNRQDLNGRFVKVIGRGVGEGKWIVKLNGSDKQISVSGDKLLRLRPKA